MLEKSRGDAKEEEEEEEWSSAEDDLMEVQ
jgi:hypothetical protein